MASFLSYVISWCWQPVATRTALHGRDESAAAVTTNELRQRIHHLFKMPGLTGTLHGKLSPRPSQCSWQLPLCYQRPFQTILWDVEGTHRHWEGTCVLSFSHSHFLSLKTLFKSMKKGKTAHLSNSWRNPLISSNISSVPKKAKDLRCFPVVPNSSF